MICYRDKTFCSFYKDCKKECDRALTEEKYKTEIRGGVMREPTQSWTRKGQDINWEVVKWKNGEKTFWNTYLYIINKDMVDKLWTQKKRIYDWGTVYIPKAILENLDWNGGQTYYHQIVDNGRRYIKVGDDYQHSWDEGKLYNEDYLINRIQQIAKQLEIILTPNPKE